MTIDGKKYSRDLIIFPEGEIKENWQRIDGHELTFDDLEDITIIKPDLLIIGTGYSGILKVLPETEKFLGDINIEVQSLKTDEAVKLFNELKEKKEKRVMAGFHLTC